jgi:hypothetical protein
MVDKKALNASIIVEATARARAGDWVYLSRLFRYSVPLQLTPDLQRVLADILDGKIRRKTLKKIRTAERQMSMAYRAESLRFRGYKAEAAVEQVCEEYGVRKRTVYTAMKAWPEYRSDDHHKAIAAYRQRTIIELQQLIAQAIAANDQRAVIRLQRLVACAERGRTLPLLPFGFIGE